LSALFSRRRGSSEPLTGIIDIGSNSIRLVVYRGLVRTPHVVFNEKVMAGLGRGVAADGVLTGGAMKTAEAALSRFAMLAGDMNVDTLRTVATAAVRDAANGKDFLARVRQVCGLEVELISGDAEARYSALGVIAGIPDADGIVGDLGGGSLELIRVAGGTAHERLSLPIGSLKLDAVKKKSTRALSQFIAKGVGKLSWSHLGSGKPFYMVGGSWRALSQLHMHLTDYPLPVVHQYAMAPEVPERLVRALARMDPKTVKAVPHLSTSRAPSLPGAAMLLRAVTRRLGSSALVASAYGLREGLLYDGLPDDVCAQDPLIAAARAEGERQGRFPEHGDALMAWMNGLFREESAAETRLREVACLLSDIAWRAHPDFRAERGLDVALHGNWVAINAHERAMLGAALFACFGGNIAHPAAALLHRLADPQSLERARRWGLALRLGQRLTGGTAAALAGGGLRRDGDVLVLTLAADHAALYGEAVQRRLKALGQAMGCAVRFETR
jgi:exopolyphosphatase / guanosine-5'-triphosphate,3'-diphosphate pyrophosphatase